MQLWFCIFCFCLEVFWLRWVDFCPLPHRYPLLWRFGKCYQPFHLVEQPKHQGRQRDLWLLQFVFQAIGRKRNIFRFSTSFRNIEKCTFMNSPCLVCNSSKLFWAIFVWSRIDAANIFEFPSSNISSIFSSDGRPSLKIISFSKPLNRASKICRHLEKNSCNFCKRFPHCSLEITEFYCRHALPCYFSQIFRQSNVIVKNLDWFDGKNLRGNEFLVFLTCFQDDKKNFHSLKIPSNWW